MGRKQGPRKGSMQFWPRKRAEKFLPRVNWKPILLKNADKKVGLLGFIGYKAGMASAFVKDNTPDSMTKGKRIIVPVTVIECPPMKIFSVRFYKNGYIVKEVINENLDKELKKVAKLPNEKTKVNTKETLEKINASDFDDIRVIVYPQVKKTGIKKTPDLAEIAVAGANISDKLNFVKENLGREISVTDVFQTGLVDVRGVTKGKGFQGPVKRFGIHLRPHKSEKGQRKPGSIGAWHPIGVRFTVPRPGQMGFFSRVIYNNLVMGSKKFSENDAICRKIFDNYGQITSDYLILKGSVQGPQKRQVLLTTAFRPTKKQLKGNYELIELR